jgi:hypothetical protein
MKALLKRLSSSVRSCLPSPESVQRRRPPLPLNSGLDSILWIGSPKPAGNGDPERGMVTSRLVSRSGTLTSSSFPLKHSSTHAHSRMNERRRGYKSTLLPPSNPHSYQSCSLFAPLRRSAPSYRPEPFSETIRLQLQPPLVPCPPPS